ncbi:MAG: Holliday junction resolvase RuvX [Patescibacteria group bacterium]
MTDEIKKYLGVDWGRARIGLALGDNETKMASPYKVVANIDNVLEVIKSEEINEVIIGEPLKMQDSKLKVDNDFINFLGLLKKKVDMPIKLVDERLTSKGADALSGTKKTKALKDAIAAMLILQTYLDKE